MNVYQITTEDGGIQYTAAHSLPSVFKHTNEEWQGTVTEVKLIEQGLTHYEIEFHRLPMDIVG